MSPKGATSPIESEADSDGHVGPVGREVRDDLLIDALARGATNVEAADRARVSTRTVTRRLENDAFAARVRQRRHELWDQASGATADHLTEAIATIVDVMREGDAGQRLRAATALLQLAETRHHETVLEDLRAVTARLEQLENEPEEPVL